MMLIDLVRSGIQFHLAEVMFCLELKVSGENIPSKVNCCHLPA